jgi:hypothetical protein
MFVPFENLAGESRIWIYQSSRSLSPAEQEKAGVILETFCDQWLAHGNPLMSSYKIDHGQFLMLSVDERWSGVSGCSIDGSVKVLKGLQEQLGVDFFDRTKAAFLVENEVKIIALREIKEALSAGILSPSTLTFNTLVVTKDQLKMDWIQSLQKTWLAKYLPKTAIA